MVAPARSYQQFCPVAVALDVLGDRWTLLLARDLLWYGPQRYGELAERNPGMSTSLLADRLKSLTDHGLIERIGDGYYRLTESGQGLAPVIGALYSFGSGFLGEGPVTNTMIDTLVSTMAISNRAALLRRTENVAVSLTVDAASRVISLAPGQLAVDDSREPDGSIVCSADQFALLLTGELDLDEAIVRGTVTLTGDREAVDAVLGALRPQPVT